PRRLEIEGVEVLLGEVGAELRQLLALAAVFLVHEARSEHAEWNLLVVERRAQRGFELRDPLRLGRDEVAEITLARELPELSPPADSGDRRAEPERRVELGQTHVALVDLRDVVRVLLAREMEVRLLVELGAEALGLGGEPVDFALLKRLRHRRP